jgi:uridine kinase
MLPYNYSQNYYIFQSTVPTIAINGTGDFIMDNKMECIENDAVIVRVATCIQATFCDASAPQLIAVSGPGGCGKSAFCNKLDTMLPQSSILPLDTYRLPREERRLRNLFGSHPDANRIDLLLEHIEALRTGKQITYPVYDTVTGTVAGESILTPEKFVLLDGEIAGYAQIASHCDFSIHLDAAPEILFARRVRRDIEQNGYNYEKVKAVFGQSMRDNETYGAYGKEHSDINIISNETFTLEIQNFRGDLRL